jgi:hypothetical protein
MFVWRPGRAIIGLQRSQPNCYCPRESPRKENDVPGTRQEFIAYLTELRGELTRDLERFESGQWKMYAGGREMLDITAERVSSLKRRVAEIDKTLLERA